ncbi:metal ABC transporter permease [Mameliella sediminis]|uniref:metal ABC transporter permease n=1 Tax=Mameliella sediminis TaxID=2836866 RepID=UPI001C48183C|nr:metal ABC transporter permease [Mameliella sediminis]MBY6112952.1 metal ABC transporter permease [Antarctobacter heliothermus]MBY6143700.1 metal ABC transporter permease [Mameliella alba]MBV7394234.1 metal ABC transporter permease [Mameliella sediminis]MBY6162354.1 metal ABC transporter permease [Mameliella alba]MBY6170828.1 metal ABC transporter permease [Mameliella alba]
MGSDFVMFSLTPMLIGVLASVACALPGNFLILRRQALIGDAISHVVLPGIVVAFLLTGVVAAGPMLLGAAGAAVVAVVLIEAIKRLGRIEPGAAMGVTFTTLFAGGVLLLEQSDTSSVHLDVEHALMGNLESLVWLRATDWSSLVDPWALAGLPEELPRIAMVCVAVIVLTLVFWRWLKISTFDEGFAQALGLPVGAIGLGLVITAAVAAVAAFDAVGSIIVIAMFICPPAAARMMTNGLERQVWWSVLFAVISAVMGYVLAGYGPLWLGGDNAVSAAGMIATVSGVILGLACLFGPHRSRVGARAEV